MVKCQSTKMAFLRRKFHKDDTAKEPLAFHFPLSLSNSRQGHLRDDDGPSDISPSRAPLFLCPKTRRKVSRCSMSCCQTREARETVTAQPIYKKEALCKMLQNQGVKPYWQSALMANLRHIHVSLFSLEYIHNVTYTKLKSLYV